MSEKVLVLGRIHESEAQARLREAAPELLAALKLARRVLTVACGEEAPYIRAAFAQIDPAIAKATGGK